MPRPAIRTAALIFVANTPGNLPRAANTMSGQDGVNAIHFTRR